MTIESAIGFAPWIVNDAAKRKAGLEQAKREMDMLAQIGGKRMAAPPAGPGPSPRPSPHTASPQPRPTHTRTPTLSITLPVPLPIPLPLALPLPLP